MKKGSYVPWHSDAPQSTNSSNIIFISCEGWYTSQFLDQWRRGASNRYVLNMVKGHHLQFGCHSPLFVNIKLFKNRAATAHHCIIQKEMDKLLGKGAIELSNGVAGFYSNVFLVPMHMVVYAQL